MPTPQVNATLTQVRAPALAEDENLPAAPGAIKFTGAEGVYYQERSTLVASAEAASNVISGLLIVPTTSLTYDRGDTVTFTTSTGTRVGIVRDIERKELPGVPADIQTTRLTLEDT